MITLNALWFYQNYLNYTKGEWIWGKQASLPERKNRSFIKGVAMGSAKNTIIPDSPAGVMAFCTVMTHKN